jgi:hypothetical protein
LPGLALVTAPCVYKFEKGDTKRQSRNRNGNRNGKKNWQASEILPPTSKSKSSVSRYAKKKVRIIKKIRSNEGNALLPSERRQWDRIIRIPSIAPICGHLLSTQQHVVAR